MAIIANGFKTTLARRLVLAGTGLTAFVCSGLYFDWSKSDWAAWVQAIGAICAIFVAGRIAAWQLQKQFEDNRELDRISRAAAELRTIEAVEKIVDFGNRRVLRIVREFGCNIERFIAIAERKHHFDISVIAEVLGDTAAIALHEIPNATIVAALINYRSCARQLNERIDYALSNHRKLDAAYIDRFFFILDDSHKKLCLAEVEITAEVDRLRKDRQSTARI